MQTQTQNYRQLTQDQRYPIQALRQNGFSLRRIAEDIGCHASSVYRELKRNQHQEGGYYATQAEKISQTRRRQAWKHSRQQPYHWTILKEQWLMKWSPERISLCLKQEQPELAVSTPTLYRWIDCSELDFEVFTA